MEATTKKWQCRACGKTWERDELYRDPMSIAATALTCGNLFCGGRCDPIVSQANKNTNTVA